MVLDAADCYRVFMKKFGPLLREFRRKSGKSLRRVASHLEITPTKLSAIERGYRMTMKWSELLETARYLKADLRALVEAMAHDDGCVKLSIVATGDNAKALAVELAARWYSLSEDEARRVLDVLGASAS